jgi:large subunit ribosomal protein L21
MYAVVKAGGKQYRVAPGDVIQVERLPGEVGDILDLDQVLLVGGGDGEGLQVGAPRVAGATVKALVLEQAKGPKILVFKKKRRKNYRRKRGHRQLQTVLRIRDIALA